MKKLMAVPRGTARSRRRGNMQEWSAEHTVNGAVVPGGNRASCIKIGLAFRYSGSFGRMFFVKGRFLKAGALYRARTNWSEKKVAAE